MQETLMDTTDSMIKYETFLKNAAFDITNPLTKKDCPKCANKYVRHVVVGEIKKYIYLCTCGHRF
jgi:hypothetical protein